MGAGSRLGVSVVLASLAVTIPAVRVVAAEGELAPTARCLLPPAGLDDGTVEAFLGEPASLTRSYPGGGLLMAARVRALAGSRLDAVPVLVALTREASEAQRRAIGAGLARAAAACVGSSPAYAERIQEEIASLEDEVLLTAFAQASDDVLAAAIAPSGAAPSPGAPAVSGFGAPGTSNAARDGSASVPAGVESYAIAGHDPYLLEGDRNDRSVSPTRP
jgi:hypothetical protein